MNVMVVHKSYVNVPCGLAIDIFGSEDLHFDVKADRTRARSSLTMSAR